MDKRIELIEKLSTAIMDCHHLSDLSDIGNVIGLVVSKFIDKEKLGYEDDDFISGIKHGLSTGLGTNYFTKSAEKILREYVEFDDINSSTPVTMLPLTIVDAMQEYSNQF